MSVTHYTISCGYKIPRLKDYVYFVDKLTAKVINIDNGTATATINNPSPYPMSPNRLKGFNINLSETESLDERYRFIKQLTISIHGHLTNSQFLMDNDYFLVVEDYDGNYYLVNVDFPSKMTYAYNLSEGQNQTDFTFTSNSNFPLLKLNWEIAKWINCETYVYNGVQSLKMLEKDYTTIDADGSIINLFDGNEFKDVDFLKGSLSLQESYDGDATVTTITYNIPLSNTQSSWHYNLLEFTQNLYAAHITPKNTDSGIFCGYQHGLQPSYELVGSTGGGEATMIKITLTEASSWGIFEFDSWSYNRDSSKKWVGIDSEVKCTSLGVGINTLMEEFDSNGTPTGRYKCLEGYESEYTNYNIVGTYTEDEVESFRTSVCTRFRSRAGGGSGLYTCIDGDKYEYNFVGNQISYDGGKTWITDGVYELGEMVESGSSWCDLPFDTEWRITDEWVCQPVEYRWTESGTTCDNANKYQNNIKEISTDGGTTWSVVIPEEYSASTLVQQDSYDCGYRTGTTSSSTYCNGDDLYVDVYYRTSRDSGTTWTTASTTPTLVEVGGCPTPPSPSGEYLTLVAQGSGSFVFRYEASTGDILCSKNGGEWTFKSDVIVNNGDKVVWKGDLVPHSSYGIGRFASTCNFTVSGNPMSLLFGDNFSGQTSLAGYKNAFHGLFHDCTKLTSIDGLVLPATTLSEKCYNYMFSSCSNLTTVPSNLLPATTLADYCYYGMFQSCSNLTTVPSNLLPATTLASHCYFDMFIYCTSLTTVPSNLLPATTLEYGCYMNMFGGCTSLTTVPSNLLPATTLADECYRGMFSRCSSLTSIPSGLLPTTILANGCYLNMFEYCTSLTTVPSNLLPATTLANTCYECMFQYCTSLTTAPKLPATTLTNACYEYMFYSCTNLNYIKCLATDISADLATSNWTYRVGRGGTFVKAASVTDWPRGPHGIPSGWEVQNGT